MTGCSIILTHDILNLKMGWNCIDLIGHGLLAFQEALCELDIVPALALFFLLVGEGSESVATLVERTVGRATHLFLLSLYLINNRRVNVMISSLIPLIFRISLLSSRYLSGLEWASSEVLVLGNVIFLDISRASRHQFATCGS